MNLLDAGSPDAVAGNLRDAALRFAQIDAELTGTWQYRQAGRPWGIVARELKKAAATLDRKLVMS